MKMAKLRRKNTALERDNADLTERLQHARRAWKDLRAANQRLVDARREALLENIQDRRKDLARVANLHQKVLQRSVGKGRAQRFYCEECNVMFPCRTMDVLARLGADLDARYVELRAS